MPFELKRSAAAAVVVVLAACAVPLQPDTAARAPELPGFGTLQWAITTPSAQAQRQFTQGVLQAYAFNEAEAVRQFKAALAQDPACAMCAWGVAWQLGPNINNSSRDGAAEALRYLSHALRHAAKASPRERALIDALALRYGHHSQARETAPLLAERCGPGAASGDEERAHPLDVAYAERLRRLVDASPTDADLLSLYAEAELIATSGAWWNETTGQPNGRIGELVTLLEQALKTLTDHTGLNHYLIHAADAAPAATRALAAADRMGRLAPGSPHLLHMPSHIYVRVGRYADATRVNEEAMSAEQKLFDAQKVQGFSISKDWRNHDQHFLWFGALMEGRGDVALAAARDLASRATGDHAFAEYRRSLPVLALLRLQRWDALRKEPVATGNKGMAQALGDSARGVAFVRGGQRDEARAALARAQIGVALVAKAHAKPKGWERMLRDISQSAVDHLQAQIASAEGRHDDALKLQAQAVAASKDADSNEPPMLGAGARLALGNLQLRAGRAADAEKTFREDLAAQPGSGWALTGLSQALMVQGKTADAKPFTDQLAQAWPLADAALADAALADAALTAPSGPGGR